MGPAFKNIRDLLGKRNQGENAKGDDVDDDDDDDYDEEGSVLPLPKFVTLEGIRPALRDCPMSAKKKTTKMGSMLWTAQMPQC